MDRDVHYRRLTAQMLRERGPGAFFESDGSENTRDLISRFKPTLVILGISEENQSCLDLVVWLRSPNVTPAPGVTILLMAKSISNETVRRSIYSGADYIIAKPTSPRVLQERIDGLALKPLPQYHTPDYTGPERRRLPSEVYLGPERRAQAEMESLSG